MQKIKILIIVILLISLCCSTSYCFSDFYTWSVNSVQTSTSISENSNGIEQNSGKILYEHNIHEKLHPASVTKVMSLLLIMEAIDSGRITLDTQIPCSENASKMGGSQIWLDPKETLTVNDMLKAICVVSANDCVVALAEYLGGTEDGFVQMMNDKAKALGMNDTTFKNCHGLDEDNHLTSAYDISLMSRELLVNHPSITDYTTIWTDSLRDGKSALSNTNKLVRNYSGCTGLKTGSTSLALFNLSASATRDGLSLIAVVMKAPSSDIRFKNASSLLDYGFSNFSYQSFANKNDIVKPINVTKGVSSSVNAVYESSPSFIVKKGEESSISYEISLNDSVQAPVSQGQILGSINYSLNGNSLSTVNLIADTSIDKIDLFTMSKHIFSKWLSLLRN